MANWSCTADTEDKPFPGQGYQACSLKHSALDHFMDPTVFPVRKLRPGEKKTWPRITLSGAQWREGLAANWSTDAQALLCLSMVPTASLPVVEASWGGDTGSEVGSTWISRSEGQHSICGLSAQCFPHLAAITGPSSSSSRAEKTAQEPLPTSRRAGCRPEGLLALSRPSQSLADLGTFTWGDGGGGALLAGEGVGQAAMDSPP